MLHFDINYTVGVQYEHPLEFRGRVSVRENATTRLLHEGHEEINIIHVFPVIVVHEPAIGDYN